LVLKDNEALRMRIDFELDFMGIQKTTKCDIALLKDRTNAYDLNNNGVDIVFNGLNYTFPSNETLIIKLIDVRTPSKITFVTKEAISVKAYLNDAHLYSAYS
jgi:hypothetical protein